MRHWHQDKRTDIGLRFAGAALWGLAWLAARQLAALHLTQTHADPDMWAVVLAAAAFLFASFGAVLITQGRHIFDRVEISERRRIIPPPGMEEESAINIPDMVQNASIMNRQGRKKFASRMLLGARDR